MFTPFAFIQSVAVAIIPTLTLQGYYIGGSFSTYSTNTNPYFRMLDSNGFTSGGFNIGTGFSGPVFGLTTQSDGKIVAIGNYTTYSGSSTARIVRLNADGTKDLDYRIGTGPASAPNAIAIQSDGKAIIGGGYTTYSGSTSNRLTRINTNGSRDTTFNVGAGPSNTVQALAIQSDGKIVIGGSFTTYSGSGAACIARVNTNGTIDTGSSWNSGQGFNTTLNGLAIQSDQKIIATGNFTTYSGSTKNYIARLNTNGTADTGSSWNQGVGFNSGTAVVGVQSDGKIVVTGAFTTYSGSGASRIARINTNGTLDTGSSWNSGTGFNNNTVDLYVQPDQKILVTGIFTSYSGSVRNGVVRINSDGTIDTAFNSNLSINTANTLKCLTQLSNGSIVLGGSFTGDLVSKITALGLSGSLISQSIVGNLGLINTPNAMALQSDGKLVIGGFFTFYSGSQANYITRINTNGSGDTTFNIGTGFNNTVNTLAIQSDGKIVAGGSFTNYSGSSANRIARINTNGTIDTGSSWHQGVGAGGVVNTLAIQSDGKIVIGGNFLTYSGSGASRIARINTNGTLDTGSSWNTGQGFNSEPNTLAIQSDGKILVGGIFTTYSGSTKNFIARLNTDGTADTGSSWNQGVGFGNYINALAIQSDGKIVAIGGFTNYSGSGANRIARVNTNGTIDTGSSWNSGVGFNNLPNEITVEPGTGKVLVVGNFTTYSGSTSNRIVRINPDGTRDATFVPTGSGFNASVDSIVPIII